MVCSVWMLGRSIEFGVAAFQVHAEESEKEDACDVSKSHDALVKQRSRSITLYKPLGAAPQIFTQRGIFQ